MYRIFPEGTYLPDSEINVEEFKEKYLSDQSNKSVVSGTVQYISAGKEFAVISFNKYVKGWMPGNKFASTEKAKSFFHVGQTVDVEIDGFNEEKKTFICSRKHNMAEVFKQMRENLHVGDVITAKIVSRKEYGYFVDIGGGNTVLLHNSMIYAKKVTHNKFFFEIGQLIYVMITGYNLEYDTFTVSYKDVKIESGLKIGNTFAVVLDENTVEGWECHFSIDESITGLIMGRKQNAKYEVGDICRVTLIGFKGGRNLFEFI